ncbi:MAG: hypothetical protein M0R03_02320 [Novosphingobium sp.]|nr:hypothetical protein [Novosphingobium sp.]
MMRNGDGKHGYEVPDALSLDEAWRQIQSMLDDGKLRFPDREAPPLMVETFKGIYPPEQLESAMRSAMQTKDAERTIIDAIRSGKLPLWIAPVEGPITERLISGRDLKQFDIRSLASGCYRPYNDTENVARDCRLFVKEHHWEGFLVGLGVGRETGATVAPNHIDQGNNIPQPSSQKIEHNRGGAPAKYDWEQAIAAIVFQWSDEGSWQPTSQADVRRKLVEHFSALDQYPSDSLLKLRARWLFDEFLRRNGDQ